MHSLASALAIRFPMGIISKYVTHSQLFTCMGKWSKCLTVKSQNGSLKPSPKPIYLNDMFSTSIVQPVSYLQAVHCDTWVMLDGMVIPEYGLAESK